MISTMFNTSKAPLGVRSLVVGVIAAAACLSFSSNTAKGASFGVQVFATGAAVAADSPDSVEFGDGSLWIAYQNGADSAGGSGASTVVRYSPAGAIQNTWSIAGNVDGLRIDPTSGLVWAMQNNDGNSALTIINPVTNGTKAYSYGTTYTANGNSAGRGFDDMVFLNGQMFMSETNPNVGTDPVIVKLTTGLSNPPLQIAGTLNSTFTGTNLATGLQGSTTIADSDSLIKTPSGGLALTGEADQQIVFVNNPGAGNQSESYISLLGKNGKTISGYPDDTVFPVVVQFDTAGWDSSVDVSALCLDPLCEIVQWNGLPLVCPFGFPKNTGRLNSDCSNFAATFAVTVSLRVNLMVI